MQLEEAAIRAEVRPIVSRGLDVPNDEKPAKKSIRFNAQLEQCDRIVTPVQHNDAVSRSTEFESYLGKEGASLLQAGGW